MYNNAYSSLILIGHRSPFFTVRRGCRQGDPLLPYLYIVCVGIAVIHIRNNSHIKGITINNCHFKLTQYADDTAFITNGRCSSMANILNSLKLFNLLSGVKINNDNTTVFSIGSNSSEKVANDEFRFSPGISEESSLDFFT